MKIKDKGIMLIAIGIIGTILVLTFDMIMGKPVNDITGPRSILGLVACVLFVVQGIIYLRKKGA
jgi:hypothetical protein